MAGHLRDFVIDRTSLLRCMSSCFLKLISSLLTNFRDAKKQVICLPQHTLFILWPKNELPFRMRFTDEWAFVPYGLSPSFHLSPSVWLSFIYPFPSPLDELSCLIPLCWCVALVLWIFHNLFPHLILLTYAVTMFSCISLSYKYRYTFSFTWSCLSISLLFIRLHTSFVSSFLRSSASTHVEHMRWGSHSKARWEAPLIVLSLLSITL